MSEIITRLPFISGLRKDPYEPDDRKLSLSTRNLPSWIDWTPQMSPVKTQGSLGACVGFATVAMKEWQEQVEWLSDPIKTARPNVHYDLSESWVYWKAKERDPWPNEEGTSIRYAMEVLHEVGVPTEEYWMYSDRAKGVPGRNSDIVAKWYVIQSYESVRNLTELRAALTRGPVVAGIEVFDEVYRPVDGYVEYPARPKYGLGGHALCFVGYDDNSERFRVKNSWGYEWGALGYGEVSYKYIEDFMWDAWSAVDGHITEKEFEVI